jgi:hypothetical protein
MTNRKKMKNNTQEITEAFLEYVKANPSERFWQALLNFTGLPYIAISPRPPGEISHELEDTYYLDMKLNKSKN